MGKSEAISRVKSREEDINDGLLVDRAIFSGSSSLSRLKICTERKAVDTL